MRQLTQKIRCRIKLTMILLTTEYGGISGVAMWGPVMKRLDLNRVKGHTHTPMTLISHLRILKIRVIHLYDDPPPILGALAEPL